MIQNFKGKGTEAIANRINNTLARRLLPIELHRTAKNLLSLINAIIAPTDLGGYSGLKLEKLKGNRAGQWSIRINKQYRICFGWEDKNAVDVEITDYH